MARARSMSIEEEVVVIPQPLPPLPPAIVRVEDVYHRDVLHNIPWKWKVVAFAAVKREQRYLDTDGVVRIAMKAISLPRLILEGVKCKI